MRKTLKPMAILAAALAASGCAVSDTVSRATPLALTPGVEGAEIAVQRNYALADVVVSVPAELTVSEANSFLPAADIVWRDDPFGDRKAQVSAVLRDAFLAGAGDLQGARPVVAELEIERWHSLTERARYTTGGMHRIRFWMTIRDAGTGAIVEPPRRIVADLPALGGQAAIRAEQQGRGQKVRLLGHLGIVARHELTGPVATGA